MMKVFHLVLVVACLAVVACQASSSLHNLSVRRVWNLKTSQAQGSITISAENRGSHSVSAYAFFLPADEYAMLAFFSASSGGVDLEWEWLDEPVTYGGESYHHCVVSLPQALSTGDSIELELTTTLYHAQVPLPASIPQAAHQLIVFETVAYFLSPYASDKQRTVLHLPTSVIESHNGPDPTRSKGSKIVFGAYENVPALEEMTTAPAKARAHYRSNVPFLTATELVREVEVSHWGNIGVYEAWEVRHTGARLRGGFSRHDFRQGMGGPSAVQRMRQMLPVGAADLYYRDAIGNITTSHVRPLESGASLFEIIPRFPLFGGWKVNWEEGYNLPTALYLATAVNDVSLHVLNLTFVVPVEQVGVERYVLRIVLPEGATDVQVHTPFPYDSMSTSLRRTYLDTSGRVVVELTKQHVVPQHERFFQVTYRFAAWSMMREPGLLVAAWFVVFASVMLFVRLDWSLQPQDGASSERKQRLLLQAVTRLGQLHQERSARLDTLRDALFRAAPKSHGPQDALTSYKDARAALDRQWAEVENSIKGLDSELGYEVREIARLEGERFTAYRKLGQLAKRFTSGKISSDEWEGVRAHFNAGIKPLQDKIAALVSELA